MKYLVSLLVLIGFVGVAFAIPPFSSQDAFDFSNTIVVGKVIGVNSTFSPTHNLYQIQVEKFLKNHQDSQILLAAGEKNTSPRSGNQVFNTGDRALFFLTSVSVGYDAYPGILLIHPLSKLIEPEWDACDVFKNNIPQEHWVFGGTGTLPKVRQGINYNPDVFQKGMPVIITYDVSNLSNSTQEFNLENSLTFGKSNSHSSVGHTIILEPCTIYKTFEASFTPRESGNYLFEIKNSRTGSTDIGFTIPDSDTETIESFNGKIFFVSPGYDAGVSANDTVIFHGLKFSSPAYPKLPNPGGSVNTMITFEDGTTKNVGFIGPGAIPSLESDARIADKPTPVLVENNKVYAGMLHDYDGIHLLVSVDAVNLSPLKQFKSGISVDKIQCKEGLVFAQKAGTGIPICIKPETKKKFAERDLIELSHPYSPYPDHN
ncbi:MAG: hypothetical protein K8Q89_10250 [Nitrosarchaeum sp.]|nr:hypothetical protein [Nitrosarchaeum sp.]